VSAIITSWVVVGLAMGLLGFFFTTRRVPGGFVTNLVTGLAGAAVGGYLVASSSQTDVVRGTLTWGNVIVAAISAILALVIMQSTAKPRGAVAPAKTTAPERSE
jgi:uncharacterized membrane protein YeaQ/YmgE (transglycosylase-associated protein family)